MADEKDNKEEKKDSKAESKADAPKAEKPAKKEAAKKESKPAAKKEAKKDSGDKPVKKESKKAAPKADKKEAKGKDAKDEKPKKSRRAKKADAKAEEKKPAPSRRRRQSSDELPVVRASAKYVRVAPRKARLIADQVRGMHIEQARALLAFSPRGAAQDIHKLIDSAAANAENNHDLIGDEMRITSITVDEGPTLRRFRPRALGRATPINKRTSHIAVALTPVEDD
jgi:ribosomal protein L22